MDVSLLLCGIGFCIGVIVHKAWAYLTDTSLDFSMPVPEFPGTSTPPEKKKK
jgi:hypothetical protein